MAVSQATIKAAIQALNALGQAGMTDDDYADAMATIISDAILSAELDGTAGGDPCVGGLI
jgi:hypothetical protein